MEIQRIIHERRDINGEQISTAKVIIQGGISQTEIDALPLSDERLTSYTEILEHSLTFRQPPNQALIEAQQQAEQLQFQLASLTEQTATLIDEKTRLNEEVTELSGRLLGLITPPIQGDPWQSDKRYTRGDSATEGDVLYDSLRFNKGKQPSLFPDYWVPRQAQPVPVVWTDMATGTSIAVGSLVIHNDQTWRCIKAHNKSIVRQPSAISDYWEEVMT